MSSIFGIISTPFGYIMRFIYEFVGSYGWSIILFALLAKVCMTPLTIKQKRGMAQTQRIQPRIQEIQRKYGKDKAKMNEKLQELYDTEGVSPMSGCGTTLLSFPIMIGLYYVISTPLTYFMQLSEEVIAQIATALNFSMTGNTGGQIGLAEAISQDYNRVAGISDKILNVDFNFLGMNLAATPSIKEFDILWLIPILSALTALAFSMVQRKIMLRSNPSAPQPGGMMMTLMMPLMSGYFGFILPAGLGIYWIINNVLSMVQEVGLTLYMENKAKKAEASKNG